MKLNQKCGFNGEELIKDKISISKYDVALREINTAIKMFFNDGDIVSMHVIVGAAHQILHDISKKKGRKYSFKESDLLGEEERKYIIDAVRVPQNYFKHSKRDSENKLTFYYQVTQFYLQDTIRMYILIKNQISEEMKIFLMWYQLRFPDMFCYEKAEKTLKKIRNAAKDPEQLKMFARDLLEKLPKGEGMKVSNL